MNRGYGFAMYPKPSLGKSLSQLTAVNVSSSRTPFCCRYRKRSPKPYWLGRGTVVVWHIRVFRWWTSTAAIEHYF